MRILFSPIFICLIRYLAFIMVNSAVCLDVMPCGLVKSTFYLFFPSSLFLPSFPSSSNRMVPYRALIPIDTLISHMSFETFSPSWQNFLS